MAKQQRKLKSKDCFIIDRSKWRCGGSSSEHLRGEGLTSLLNEHNYMCCLGQISLQCGVRKKELLNQAEPADLECIVPSLTIKKEWKHEEDSGYDYLNTKLSKRAMKINDDPYFTDEERERKLKSLFSKFKKKLIFKGKYSKAT